MVSQEKSIQIYHNLAWDVLFKIKQYESHFGKEYWFDKSELMVAFRLESAIYYSPSPTTIKKYVTTTAPCLIICSFFAFYFRTRRIA